MSTSVPHQTAALHHIGQLRRVAALKATQEMLKHNRMAGLWKSGQANTAACGTFQVAFPCAACQDKKLGTS